MDHSKNIKCLLCNVLMDYRTDVCTKVDLTHLFDEDDSSGMKLFFIMCSDCLSHLMKKDKDDIQKEMNSLLNNDLDDVNIINDNGTLFIHA
jgi:hypothetical protein